MVNFEHQLRHFRPENLEEGTFEGIVLTVDELEAMRLSFLEDLSQTEAAACMEIHQSTFQRTLRRALEKVTEAFVYGKSVKIEGGDYRMPGGDGNGPAGQEPGVGRKRGGRGQCRNRGGTGGGPEGTCVCPECGYEMPHRSGVPCID